MSKVGEHGEDEKDEGTSQSITALFSLGHRQNPKREGVLSSFFFKVKIFVHRY